MSRPLAVTQQQVQQTAHLNVRDAATVLGVHWHTVDNARRRYMPEPLTRHEWKMLRSVKGLTQAEAAKKLGISTHVFRKLTLRAASQTQPLTMPWWKKLFMKTPVEAPVTPQAVQPVQVEPEPVLEPQAEPESLPEPIPAPIPFPYRPEPEEEPEEEPELAPAAVKPIINLKQEFEPTQDQLDLMARAEDAFLNDTEYLIAMVEDFNLIQAGKDPWKNAYPDRCIEKDCDNKKARETSRCVKHAKKAAA